MYGRKGMVTVYFLPQLRLSGRYRYKASILDNKQLLSNVIAMHKATLVPYTPEMLSLKIATYFAQTSHPFFTLLL